MTHFTIIGTEPGSMVQWIGTASTQAEAAATLAEDIGGDETAETIMRDHRVIEVTSDQATQVQAWMDKGSPADECPGCIA